MIKISQCFGEMVGFIVKSNKIRALVVGCIVNMWHFSMWTVQIFEWFERVCLNHADISSVEERPPLPLWALEPSAAASSGAESKRSRSLIKRQAAGGLRWKNAGAAQLWDSSLQTTVNSSRRAQPVRRSKPRWNVSSSEIRTNLPDYRLPSASLWSLVVWSSQENIRARWKIWTFFFRFRKTGQAKMETVN